MVEPGNLADRAAAHATIGSSLDRALALLHGQSDSAPLDVELLLAHVLQQSRSYLKAHPELALDESALRQFQLLLNRRARGEPVAYLLGAREFWSMHLTVTPAVLVPRPETELAVERCLALRADVQTDALDLGTGSGAIALALARERRQWALVASDVSADALQVARTNAQQLGLSAIEFVQGEWFEPFNARHFDLVVSNPPYVAQDDPALDALRFEPALALTSGATGFEALQSIILQARTHLNPLGWLVLEHGSSQAPKLAQRLVAAGYARVRCYTDLAGHDRVTQAQWPST